MVTHRVGQVPRAGRKSERLQRALAWPARLRPTVEVELRRARDFDALRGYRGIHAQQVCTHPVAPDQILAETRQQSTAGHVVEAEDRGDGGQAQLLGDQGVLILRSGHGNGGPEQVRCELAQLRPHRLQLMAPAVHPLRQCGKPPE